MWGWYSGQIPLYEGSEEIILDKYLQNVKQNDKATNTKCEGKVENL